MRFVSVGQKTIVVVVLLAVNGLLVLILNPFAWDPGSVALSLLQLAGWYLASRVFRGSGEPAAPARPWWRMTARPFLSGFWAVLYAAGIVASLVGLFLVDVTPGDLVSLLVQAALALLFALSFRRLRRLQQEQRTRPASATRARATAKVRA